MAINYTEMDLHLGYDPVITATVDVKASINSSNSIVFTCNYTLNALSSPAYWGYGVIIQARTCKYDPDAEKWGSWSDWGSKTIISESTSTWSKKTDKFTRTVTGCTSATNAMIQIRLRDVGADYKTDYNEVTFAPDAVKLNVAKGSNVSAVSKSPNQSYHLYGDSVTVNCTLATATGYQIKFNKWTSSNTDKVANSTSQKYTFTVSDEENVTLTASATKTANSGTIYYYPNGGTAQPDYPLITSGTYSGASSSVGTFTYEDTARNLWNVHSLFTRTGYHCPSDAKAWHLNSATSTTYINQASQNMSSFVADNTGVVLKLYANWEINTYSIKYNSNGGTGTMSDSSHTYNTAKALTTNAFKRTGYDFLGWSTSATGSVVYQDGESVKNLTETHGDTVNLYAVWKVHTGTIYYHPNGGDGTEEYPLNTSGTYAGFSATTQVIDYTKTNLNPWDVTSLFTRQGYHVHSDAQAWRVNSPTASTYVNQTTINAANYLESATNVVIKLYANWVANTYSVKYNSNSGYGAMSDTSHTYDTAKTLAVNAFKKSGYKFVGWATSADGEVVYEDGESVKNLTATNGGTVTLYAIWDYDNLCYYGVEDSNGNITYKPTIINYCPDGVSYHQCMMLICKDASKGWEVTGI